jgi:hypothetical protein
VLVAPRSTKLDLILIDLYELFFCAALDRFAPRGVLGVHRPCSFSCTTQPWFSFCTGAVSWQCTAVHCFFVSCCTVFGPFASHDVLAVHRLHSAFLSTLALPTFLAYYHFSRCIVFFLFSFLMTRGS